MDYRPDCAGRRNWNSENMAAVARTGVTHIIDMQIEFDDTPLAEPHAIEVLWNPTDDDFQSKPPELFQRGVDFALSALKTKTHGYLSTAQQACTAPP